MKHIALLCVLFTTFLLTAAAETFSGTLVDVMCQDNQLPTHPRKCAITCARHGYGLKQAGGKFLKFDDQGNARALAALKRSTKAQDLKAQVTGTLEGGVLKVDSIVIGK